MSAPRPERQVSAPTPPPLFIRRRGRASSRTRRSTLLRAQGIRAGVRKHGPARPARASLPSFALERQHKV
eukprot:1829333-Alexandrium_andersonii.AAC.1